MRATGLFFKPDTHWNLVTNSSNPCERSYSIESRKDNIVVFETQQNWAVRHPIAILAVNDNHDANNKFSFEGDWVL